MRKILSEKNVLNNFLKEHAYRLSQISSRGSNITIHPLRNIMDVSVLGTVLHSTPWCSSLALGSSGGDRWDVGPGAPAVDRNPGQQRPHPEQKALSSSILVLVTGPRNYQVAGKHPFLCQRCVISLREIVLSEQKATMTHYSTLAWNNPRMERPGRL